MSEASEIQLAPPSPEANLSQMNLKVCQLVGDWLHHQAESKQERKKQRHDSMSDSRSETRVKNDFRRIGNCLEGLIDEGHIESWFPVGQKSKFKFPVDLVIFLSDKTIMPLKVASTNEKGRRARREIEELYGQTADQVLPVLQYIDYNGYPVSQEKMTARMLEILATGPRIKV